MNDTVIKVAEGDCCPVDGCHWVVVWCDCEESLAEGTDPRGHLICLGCGQDADQTTPAPSSPCDCKAKDQPAPDEANYRDKPAGRAT